MFKCVGKFCTALLLLVLGNLYVGANVLSEEFAPCSDDCPPIYTPICATNGNEYKEFMNECVQELANCYLKRSSLKPFEKIDGDWCTTEYVESLSTFLGDLDLNRPECSKPCTFMYQPICVTNGRYRSTAASPCVLDLYNCALQFAGSKSNLTVLREGEC